MLLSRDVDANLCPHLDPNHGLIAKYFQDLAHENTMKSRAILVKADQVADALNLDDELLDTLGTRNPCSLVQ